MDALTLYRWAHRLWRARVPLLPDILQGIIFVVFNSHIPYQADIGEGPQLGHRGISVVINRRAIIGKRVLIRAHVTIGTKVSGGAAPVIDDDVEVGDGAKVLGGVRIGRGARIGANAVVVKDVPAGAVAVGVPAEILVGGVGA